MRRYEKPVMQVERFEAATSVADCTRQIDHSVTSYTEQEVTCKIVSGTDKVFTSGCINNIETDNSKHWFFATVSGVDYFVWYDGYVDENAGPPSAEAESLIKALGISGSGWHAGTYESSITNYFTLSN